MIKVDNKLIINTIYIPRNFPDNEASYELKLMSRSTNKEWLFEVEDIDTFEIWYKFNVDFSSLDNGEYEYELYRIDNDEMILASGLIRIGYVKKEPTIPNNKKIYELYNG